MNAIVEAKKIFAERGINFEERLGWYLMNGVVISTPERFIMAKAIRKDVGPDDWNPDKPDCWWVDLAAGKGSIRWWLEQAPFKLPFIGWMRSKQAGNRLKFYSTDAFQRHT